jgi:hypothetical protein
MPSKILFLAVLGFELKASYLLGRHKILFFDDRFQTKYTTIKLSLMKAAGWCSLSAQNIL